MNKNNKTLNAAQYRLRKYILEMSEANQIGTPENIKALLPEYDVKDFKRKINKDIRLINAIGPYDKPIISFHNGGYKIPTRDEYQTYSKSRWNEIGRMAKLQHQMDLKASLEGQGKIGIDPHGSDTFEPFIRNEVNQDVIEFIN